jgi:hypothetical protein
MWDAIIFWFVHDHELPRSHRSGLAAVASRNDRSSMLSALLSERTAADELLRSEIGRKTAD